MKPLKLTLSRSRPFLGPEDDTGKDEEEVSAGVSVVTAIVFSAVRNFERRAAIRKTWGQELKQLELGNNVIFILGRSQERGLQVRVMKKLKKTTLQAV